MENMNVTPANFRVTYDGPALELHTIDVRELAPALLALSDLLDAANRALSGDAAQVRVEVRASFKTGSFGIDLVVFQGLKQQFLSFFNSPGVTATLNATALIGLLFGARMGLVRVLKWIRGRSIKRIEVSEETATIITADDERLEIERSLLELLRNRETREEMERVLAPLGKEGIHSVSFGTDTEIHTTITRQETAWFAVPEEEDAPLLDDVRKMSFSIVSLTFKEDNKWRLFDGNATFHAVIEDTEFLTRVSQNMETFAKNDILVCQVRIKQWQSSKGVKTEYLVEKVLEHKQAGRQLALPLTKTEE
jgi:hypothetical protein